MRVRIACKAQGAAEILRGVDLQVGPRETVALLGPSGVGKTTLLRIVAGLDARFEGEVTGVGRAAMVFQEPTLMPWRTALENVRIAAHVSAREAARMLDRVGLAGRRDAYPRALSLGQQRRVAIARALAVRPETLLMDEPFVSLDPEASQAMQDLLAELLAETPARALLVTHARAEALRLADRVLHLGGSPACVTREERLGRAAARDAG